MTNPLVKPSRPVYPPLVPVGFTDPGGKTPAEKALRTQQAVADLYTRWRQAHSRDIDPDVLKNNAGAFSVSDAALTLPEALAAVKDEAAAADQKSKDLINNTRVAGNETSQLAAQRFWQRKRELLESIKDGPKVAAAARDLVANADDAQVPVLAEELGDYLASRNVPTGWLPDALAAKIPGLADAQADAIVKARQYAILAQNHNSLTNAMAKDVAAPPLMDPADVTPEPYTGRRY